MGRDCQAISSSFGVVTWKEQGDHNIRSESSLSRIVTLVTIYLVSFQPVKESDADDGGPDAGHVGQGGKDQRLHLHVGHALFHQHLFFVICQAMVHFLSDNFQKTTLTFCETSCR